MTTITNYFEQAQLSLAAYALDLRRGMSGAADTDYTNALKAAGMSASQAEEFANTYTIVDQSPTDPDGFSATLFADRLDPARKILAIRGVDNAFDFLKHVVDIGLLGTSDLVLEYRSLKNYYQQLVTQGLLGEGETFTVTGHSLGGFLAQLFTVDHANVVSHSNTYNAPGIGGAVAEVLSAFGVTQTSIPGSLITNVFAQTGPEFVAGAGTLLGSAQPVFIENQGLLAIPGNHGIVPLTDSLAVYNLFARLSPMVSVDTITNILKAASHTQNTATTVDKSLENTLDAVRGLIADYQQGSSTASVTPTIPNDRDDFYTNFLNLQRDIKGLSFYNPDTQSLGLNLLSLADADAAGLAASAKFSAATRYALLKLNPFIVTGNNAIYDQINTDGSLTLYDPAAGTGALSDQYLKDRSAFLINKVLSGTGDKIAQSGDPLAIRNGSPLYFEDRGRTTTYGLYQGVNNAVSEIPFEEISQIIFGHAGIDLIGGSDQADHLYGMQGNDTLQGNQGNDYLEGGQGTDTYTYTSGDGLDTILDTDGLGQITFDGTILNGGDKLIGDTYRSADGNYFYTLLHNAGQQDSLLINAMGGQIVVKDFQSGELGINLGPAAAPPEYVNVIIGEPDWSDSLWGGPDNDIIRGLGGNDFISAGSGDDLVYGNEGDDTLYGDHFGEIGQYGDDQLYGEAGDDVLNGYGGDDVLDGGAGDDVLHGDYYPEDAGDDTLWGDLDNAVYNQDQQIAETHGTLMCCTLQTIRRQPAALDAAIVAFPQAA